MPVTDIITQRQFRVIVKDTEAGGLSLPGEWDILSGAGMTTTASEYWPAGERNVVRLQGPSNPKPITISRGYAPSRDDAMLRSLRASINSIRLNVEKTPKRRNGDTYGDTVVYGDCIITDMNDPSMDSASGEVARIEITLQPTTTSSQ